MRSARAAVGQLSLLGECLDSQDRAVLGFAREHHLQGRVRARVQAELGLNETRYYQLLLALMSRPEVAEAEPDLVTQLRGMLERRRRRR